MSRINKRALIRGMLGEMQITQKEAATLLNINHTALCYMLDDKSLDRVYDALKVKYEDWQKENE